MPIRQPGPEKIGILQQLELCCYLAKTPRYTYFKLTGKFILHIPLPFHLSCGVSLLFQSLKAVILGFQLPVTSGGFSVSSIGMTSVNMGEYILKGIMSLTCIELINCWILFYSPLPLARIPSTDALGISNIGSATFIQQSIKAVPIYYYEQKSDSSPIAPCSPNIQAINCIQLIALRPLDVVCYEFKKNPRCYHAGTQLCDLQDAIKVLFFTLI